MYYIIHIFRNIFLNTDILLIYNIPKYINTTFSIYITFPCMCMSSRLTTWYWTNNSFLLSYIAVFPYGWPKQKRLLI